MRNLLFALTGLAVLGLAFWAYQENYRTQQVTREIKSLNLKIAEARGALSILNAEWAYLNRPDRLRELAELNFDRLGLLPLASGQFARVDQIAWPAPFAGVPGVVNPVDVLGSIDEPAGISLITNSEANQ